MDLVGFELEEVADQRQPLGPGNSSIDRVGAGLRDARVRPDTSTNRSPPRSTVGQEVRHS